MLGVVSPIIIVIATAFINRWCEKRRKKSKLANSILDAVLVLVCYADFAKDRISKFCGECCERAELYNDVIRRLPDLVAKLEAFNVQHSNTIAKIIGKDVSSSMGNMTEFANKMLCWSYEDDSSVLSAICDQILESWSVLSKGVLGLVGREELNDRISDSCYKIKTSPARLRV